MARFKSINGRRFSGRKPYILFLCTGNTCRSPMVFGILKQLFKEAGIDDIEIRTAGVMTIPGLLPTQEVRQIMEKDQIDVSAHRSSKMTPDLLRRAHLILGMTSFHVQMALRMSSEARGKTYLLKEYVGMGPRNSQIQDPMGSTLEVYKKVYREVRRALKRLVTMDLHTPQGPLTQEQKKDLKPGGKTRSKPEPAAAKPEADKETPEAQASPSEDTSKQAKTAPKKSAVKKTTTKAVKKKPAKKPVKKTAKKTVKKSSRKQTTPKQSTAKKAAPKKSTAKKKPAKKTTPNKKSSAGKAK